MPFPFYLNPQDQSGRELNIGGCVHLAILDSNGQPILVGGQIKDISLKDTEDETSFVYTIAFWENPEGESEIIEPRTITLEDNKRIASARTGK